MQGNGKETRSNSQFKDSLLTKFYQDIFDKGNSLSRARVYEVIGIAN